MSNSFVVGIPIMNQPETSQKCLDLINQRQGTRPPVVIVDNGSEPRVRDWLVGLQDGDQVIRNEPNVGVTKALNQIWHVAKDMGADYVINIHNDVYIYEDGWVDKIDRIFESRRGLVEIEPYRNVGVAGFFGAYGIGRADIYRSKYDFTQLARQQPVSGIKCRVAHNQLRLSGRNREWDYVAVLDGFSLITRVEMLEKVGGFDDKLFPIHHNYDNHLCLESINAGYTNVVIDMDVDHHGGMTDVGEDWAKPFGKTKDQVHKEAHPPMYEHWRPGKHKICLPYRVI